MGRGWMLMRGPFTFLLYLGFHFKGFPETLCLENSTNALQMFTVLCDWAVTKGALPGEQSTFSSLSWYHSCNFPEL